MDGTAAVRNHVEWMNRRGLRASTIKLRRGVLRRLELHAGKSLLRVTLTDIRAFLDRLYDAGSRSTERTHIRCFYKWAALEGYLREDPAFRLEAIRKRKYLPRPISDGELARALLDPPERVRPMLWLAAYAGLRASDIAQLRAEYLMFDRCPPMIFVEDSKGGKQRTVPMAPVLCDRLRELPAAGWCFPYQDGRPGPIPPHMVSKLCNEYLHSIGIEATLHQLRHWFITKAYAVNRDLVVTQGLAGHETSETTRGYTWTDPGAAAETVQQLPDITR
jgi:integrase